MHYFCKKIVKKNNHQVFLEVFVSVQITLFVKTNEENFYSIRNKTQILLSTVKWGNIVLGINIVILQPKESGSFNLFTINFISAVQEDSIHGILFCLFWLWWIFLIHDTICWDLETLILWRTLLVLQSSTNSLSTYECGKKYIIWAHDKSNLDVS